MPRRDEKVSGPDPEDEDFPTIADEQPIRRIARSGAPALPSPGQFDDEATIEAATVDAPTLHKPTLQKPGAAVRPPAAPPRPKPSKPPPKAKLPERPPPSPRAPSGQFLVPNVPVPTRPPSMSGMRAPSSPASAKMPENFGETMETSHNAFESLGMQASAGPQTSSQSGIAQSNPAHESTQYLISAVMPHPLAKPVQPEPRLEPVPPPKVYAPPPPQPIPPPPLMLIIVAVLLAVIAVAAILYVLFRR